MGYKRLKPKERVRIEIGLHDGKSIRQIAKEMGRSPSNISREIQNNKTTGLQPKKCTIPNKPFICNVCEKRKQCSVYRKSYYNSDDANWLSNLRKHDSRIGVRKSKAIFDKVRLVMDNAKDNNQSVEQAFYANEELHGEITPLTIRNWIHDGLLTMKDYDLRMLKKMKNHPKPRKMNEGQYIKNRDIVIEHSFQLFLEAVAGRNMEGVVQFDSFEGKRSDNHALLTSTIVKYNFQFAPLIEKGDQLSVLRVMTDLFNKLGRKLTQKLFGICLCDNGCEFSHFYELEYWPGDEKLIRVFYTRPNIATDKAKWERLHRILRYQLPKSKSLDWLTQDIVDEVMSRQNNIRMKSLRGISPYEAVLKAYGKEFLDKINIRWIEPKKVRLIALA